MLCVFFAWCYHDVCSDIFERPLSNIKLDRYLVPTGTFLLFSFLMMPGTRTQKKLPIKSQRKAIVEKSFQGASV